MIFLCQLLTLWGVECRQIGRGRYLIKSTCGSSNTTDGIRSILIRCVKAQSFCISPQTTSFLNKPKVTPSTISLKNTSGPMATLHDSNFRKNFHVAAQQAQILLCIFCGSYPLLIDFCNLRNLSAARPKTEKVLNNCASSASNALLPNQTKNDEAPGNGALDLQRIGGPAGIFSA